MWQFAKKPRVREKHAPTTVLDHWAKKCTTENPVEIRAAHINVLVIRHIVLSSSGQIPSQGVTQKP